MRQLPLKKVIPPIQPHLNILCPHSRSSYFATLVTSTERLHPRFAFLHVMFGSQVILQILIYIFKSTNAISCSGLDP